MMNGIIYRNRLQFYFICYLAVIGSIVISCEKQQGSIYITAFPVSGSVYIDGKLKGETPLSVEISVGEHEISFSEYSEQYRKPPSQKISVKEGIITEITGIYHNLFIPDEPPDGFSPADSIRIYGTSDRKLKDGTIYDYINGGGLVYLNHGLRETTHMVFHDDSGNNLIVDIFDMASENNAKASLHNEEICPPGFISYDIGTGSKAYHYKPDFFLYFIKSKYLIYMGTTHDSLKGVVETFAENIAVRIPDNQ